MHITWNASAHSDTPITHQSSQVQRQYHWEFQTETGEHLTKCGPFSVLGFVKLHRLHPHETHPDCHWWVKLDLWEQCGQDNLEMYPSKPQAVINEFFIRHKEQLVLYHPCLKADPHLRVLFSGAPWPSPWIWASLTVTWNHITTFLLISFPFPILSPSL